MPKKVKKGGGKTEEERLLQLQQRVQAEEEMAKKKEEMLTLYLQDKLQKEQKNSALNLLKLNDVWRTRMRQTQVLELRGQTFVLRQTFERKLDHLNSIIQKVRWELQEAELQGEQVQRKHLQEAELLQKHQDQDLVWLQQRWENYLEDLQSTYASESEQMLAQIQQQDDQLQSHMLERRNREDMEDIWLRESLLALGLNMDQAYVADMEETGDGGPQQLQIEIQLDQQTSRKQEQVEPDLRTIARLMAKINRLRETRTSMPLEGEDDVTRTSTPAEDDVMRRNQSAVLDQKCQEVLDHMAGSRRAAQKQLAELSRRGEGAARGLRAAVTQGETLVFAADTCRNMEKKHAALSSSSWLLRDRQDRDEFQESLSSALLHREHLRGLRDHLIHENLQLDILDRPPALLVASRAVTADGCCTVMESARQPL